MIKLTNVNKMFHSVEPVHALAEVSFHVKNANWVTVLGPSGSGKTTLLNVISGMEQIDSGDMDVDGQSLLSISAAELQDFRRNTIGYIFQDYRLFDQFSVIDNVMLPQVPYRSRKDIEITAHTLLQRLNMGTG